MTVTLDPADQPTIYASTAQQSAARCGVLDGPTPDGVALTQPVDEQSIEAFRETLPPTDRVHRVIPHMNFLPLNEQTESAAEELLP